MSTKKCYCTLDQLRNAETKGFVKKKRNDVMEKLGITRDRFDRNSAKIYADLLHYGFEEMTIKYTDRQRNLKRVQYFVADYKKLEAFLISEGAKNIAKAVLY